MRATSTHTYTHIYPNIYQPAKNKPTSDKHTDIGTHVYIKDTTIHSHTNPCTKHTKNMH